ncbi:MAG: hypothetical protein ACLFUB_19230 [Cyclobacteriaceae bacterium]
MGYGFAKLGQESLKRNRELKNQRKSMGDNPYAANKTERQEKESHYTELKQWRNAKDKKEKRVKRIVYAIMIVIIISVLVFTHFIQ